MSQSSNKFIVGLLSFLLLLLLGAMILWKSHFQIRKKGYSLRGEFTTVSGLIKGADVRYRGFKVGSISQITPKPKYVYVLFMLNKGLQVPVGSKFSVRFDGIVGETYLNIDPNDKSEIYYKDGDTVKGYASSDLSRFLDVGAKGLIQAEEILHRLNQLLNSKDTQFQAKAMFNNVHLASREAAKFMKKLNQSSDFAALADTMQHLKQVSQRLDMATSVFFDVQNDEDPRVALRQLKTDMQSTMAQLNQVSAQASQLLSDENVSNFSMLIKNSRMVSDELRHLLVNEESDRPFGFDFVRTLSKLELGTESSIMHASTEALSFYEAGFDLRLENHFLRLGVGDRFGGNRLLHIQQGVAISSDVDARLGLYNETPALGFDYHKKRLRLSIDIYDPNQLKYNLISAWRIHERFSVLLGTGSNKVKDKDANVLTGLSLKF
eukprot:COSAG01_NODE_412_length_17370_cov_26.910196_7_plen_435_part_00